MKKIISLVIATLLISAFLTSCSGSSTAPYVDYGEAEYNSTSQSIADAAPMPEAGLGYSTEVKSTVDNGDALTAGSQIASLSGDKIIYNYSATVETTKFDETIKNVDMLLSKYGAFVESSYISGNSYSYTSYRTADYTFRVPVNNFKSMTGSLPLLGNVLNENTTSQNITAQFIDTQSRLDTYKTEESRLLVMLDKAETVQDMITIESRLSDIRYQIESLTSSLTNWQNQVDFSTVTIRISEVAELSEQLSVQRTYWEQLADGVNATFKGIGNFFKGLFMVFVVSLPVLLILAVIAIIVIVIIRVTTKKNRRNNNQDINK